MINYSVSWSSAEQTRGSVARDPLQEGLLAHRSGDLEKAISGYTNALKARSNRVIASFNLGVALLESSYLAASIPHFRRAYEQDPASETFASALLFDLVELGRVDEALGFVASLQDNGRIGDLAAGWRPALERLSSGGDASANPFEPPVTLDAAAELPDRSPGGSVATPPQTSMQAEFAQAIKCYQAGRFAELVDVLEPQLKQHPEWGEAYHLLGLSWLSRGDFVQAAALLHRAADLLSGRAEVWDHLGVALARKGDSTGARDAFERSLALDPLRAETWNNLADAARMRGCPKEAFECALRAVKLAPTLKPASAYLIQSAYEADQDAPVHSGALAKGDPLLPVAIREARALARRGSELVAHVVELLMQIGHYAEAKEILEREIGVERDPPPKLLAQLVTAQRYLCDWRDLDGREVKLCEQVREGNASIISPFSALAVRGLSAADLQAVARVYGQKYRGWSARATELGDSAPPSSARRLKVGYLSNDFFQHATAYLTAALFEHHDRDKLEVFGYSTGPDDGSAMRTRLREAIEHFVDISSLNHVRAAQRIRDDGIDVLVDLKGYTSNNRLEILALRPCPLQVSWLAFPGGLGVPFIDYLIADPLIVPPEQATFYDEAVAYLPDTYAPVDPHRSIAAQPSREDAGLPADVFVFCCFNEPYKITPDVFDHWCNLLRAIPQSVLWLYASREGVSEGLRREAAAREIAPERLIFASKLPQAEHLARLGLADLFLDTLPVNAHTTASDALSAGVPVVTCLGGTFASRVAASLLKASGLAELTVQNLSDYEILARDLATDPARLTAIRQKLVDARVKAPYFDIARFARNIEGLYQRMWRRQIAGEAPTMLDPIACQAERSDIPERSAANKGGCARTH
ncbi:tetratricopeptide repeat protein [Thiorhodococcus mannitoliphagus]|uniref:protein O-GlcNAc transferase n=1 Tax=Thiorhodococcus mannitoliphagus TaxID=329406 RepID=A0A6P1DMG5_9GAMM|nr:tetratricopeptide repeat protein [Thiorhodococcus mannitoliphagus]NEX19238.1 tetratricopeptide repeat protein [Thiorhodococcus mannitoliphagus]